MSLVSVYVANVNLACMYAFALCGMCLNGMCLGSMDRPTPPPYPQDVDKKTCFF